MRHLSAIVTLILIIFSSQAFCQVLEIHHINVGQGDSTLVVGPNGTSILIDAGNNGYFSLDGGKIVFEYLESFGINSLDYAVVTHRDGDHVGGFAFSTYATSRHSLLMAQRESGVIKSWAGLSGIDDDGNGFIDFTGDDGCAEPVKTPDAAELGFNGTDPYFPSFVYDNGEDSTITYCSLTKTFRRYVQTVEAAGVRNPLGTYADLMNAYNDPIDLGDGATATVVCSSGWVAGNPTRISGTDRTNSLAVNSRSVGLYIQYKDFDYLVAGDLTGNDSPYMEQAVKDLLVSISDSPKDDPVDVLRINHHGSNSSSDQSYLNAMKPEVAIMSLGDGNSYGHPKQEVIDRLNNVYQKPLKHLYLTEEGEIGRNYYDIPHDFLNGAVIVVTDGHSYTIKNSKGGIDSYKTDQKTNIPITQIPRYRLYNPYTFHHHYTTDANEYNVLETLGWIQEGTGCYFYNGYYTIDAVETVPYYRLYNPNSFEHHWTIDANEYNVLGALGWIQEGADGFVFATQVSGSEPLYRLYNPNDGLHHWTMDTNERTVLIGNGFIDEGIACYVFP